MSGSFRLLSVTKDFRMGILWSNFIIFWEPASQVIDDLMLKMLQVSKRNNSYDSGKGELTGREVMRATSVGQAFCNLNIYSSCHSLLKRSLCSCEQNIKLVFFPWMLISPLSLLLKHLPKTIWKHPYSDRYCANTEWLEPKKSGASSNQSAYFWNLQRFSVEYKERKITEYPATKYDDSQLSFRR